MGEILGNDWQGFPGDSVVKDPAYAGDAGSMPWLGRPSGEGNGNPLQYSCPGNHMDREAWGLQSMRLQSQTRLNDQTATMICMFLHWTEAFPHSQATASSVARIPLERNTF